MTCTAEDEYACRWQRLKTLRPGLPQPRRQGAARRSLPSQSSRNRHLSQSSPLQRGQEGATGHPIQWSVCLLSPPPCLKVNAPHLFGVTAASNMHAGNLALAGMLHLSSCAQLAITCMLSCLVTQCALWTGNIASWGKKEGDQIAAGDAIADIETDKATMTWEAQDEAFLAKILVKEGTQDVQVGAPVAVLVEEQVWHPDMRHSSCCVLGWCLLMAAQ